MSTVSQQNNLVNIREACCWATKFLRREISPTNISYLIQYGKVKKYGENGSTQVNINDLKKYYQSFNGKREVRWKQKLGDDLNWELSFDNIREKDSTKHVHRLHPYKGKFIPQLVEYFLDNHIDDFKTQVFFQKGDIILDPFSGSGTMLVQANELGMHAIGVDISKFNCTITDSKLLNYDFDLLIQEINNLKKAIQGFETKNNVEQFEKELLSELTKFNKQYFPSPQFKRDVYIKKINENIFSKEKEAEFLKIYNNLIKKYKIKLRQNKNDNFLDKWYIKNTRDEINFAFEQLKKVNDEKIKRILAIVLSRTIRSCRATTHSDLATLKEPQLTTYYCFKHKKICKPLFSIKYWFTRYANDTISRLREFSRARTDANWMTISADSRTVDIFDKIEKRSPKFSKLLQKQKIRGIFSSPPYVGQIDYHEQHAYAYDLFGFERKDELEIGPLYKGQGKKARESYTEGIVKVLINARKFMVDDFDVFLVANDKWNLYPTIAQKAGMKIVNQFKRPVLNRTERDKNPYSEIIFHLKNNL